MTFEEALLDACFKMEQTEVALMTRFLGLWKDGSNMAHPASMTITYFAIMKFVMECQDWHSFPVHFSKVKSCMFILSLITCLCWLKSVFIKSNRWAWVDIMLPMMSMFIIKIRNELFTSLNLKVFMKETCSKPFEDSKLPHRILSLKAVLEYLKSIKSSQSFTQGKGSLLSSKSHLQWDYDDDCQGEIN